MSIENLKTFGESASTSFEAPSCRDEAACALPLVPCSLASIKARAVYLALPAPHEREDSWLIHHLIIDPFAEADEDTGETKQSQNYIHIRIQRTYLIDSVDCLQRACTDKPTLSQNAMVVRR